ncbi:uncharacterized protein LOC132734151 isoform X2 [Ruditapes philippinarum]|uniref:uncharacterized protein LOC132734151 isoform X2 n=1 Tax=Ruditapes philippinarum TaxID=129788 RepID=UPI00295A6FF4|nr:uncharacterized protein LOC132734151 isoform X2 [Ruditapes philippinarum]
MGVINSKRKFSIKRIKKKKARKEQTTDTLDEPVYEEIGLERENDARNASDGSYISVPSLDSAFYERSPNTTLRSNSSLSSLLYDEPEVSVSSRSARLYDGYPSLGTIKRGGDDDDDDHDDDDAHTYVSDMSLRDTDSDSTSLKKYVPTKTRNGLGRPYTSSVPLDDVPYMVEAFQPLLEHTIDVTEVVPHIPFIDAHEFLGGDDAATKVNLLIKRIKSCDEPGKWQAFLHALNQAEYEYIVSLLRGETEDDHSVNRHLLKLFTPQIMNRIDPEEFIDHLFEKGVINERDKEEVRCEKDRRGAIAASFMLLHKVPRRVTNWFAVFLNVLENCGMEDLIPQFNIPEISVATMDLDQENELLDENKYYITPTNDNYDEDIMQTKVPFNRPLQDRKRAIKSSPKRTQAPSIKPPPPPVRVSPIVVRPHSRPKTQIELLKEKKDALQREIEEKRLIRLYRREVKALQYELEKLKNSDETDGEEDEIESTDEMSREELANDVSNGYVIEDIETENLNNEETNDERITEPPIDIGLEQIDIENEQEQVIADQIQQISALFTEMRHELKNDILAMRDHVTETVLNSVLGLISKSASTEAEGNGYVMVENEQTVLPYKRQLYSTSNKYMRGLMTPKSHSMQTNISMDSAMFSDLSYV